MLPPFLLQEYTVTCISIVMQVAEPFTLTIILFSLEFFNHIYAVEKFRR